MNAESLNAITREMGAKLKIARVRRRWSQKELATRVGVSRQTIERIEAGDPMVSVGRLLAVFHTLGLPVSGWEELADPGADVLGLSMELQRAPNYGNKSPKDRDEFTIG